MPPSDTSLSQLQSGRARIVTATLPSIFRSLICARQRERWRIRPAVYLLYTPASAASQAFVPTARAAPVFLRAYGPLVALTTFANWLAVKIAWNNWHREPVQVLIILVISMTASSPKCRTGRASVAVSRKMTPVWRTSLRFCLSRPRRGPHSRCGRRAQEWLGPPDGERAAHRIRVAHRWRGRVAGVGERAADRAERLRIIPGHLNLFCVQVRESIIASHLRIQSITMLIPTVHQQRVIVTTLDRQLLATKQVTARQTPPEQLAREAEMRYRMRPPAPYCVAATEEHFGPKYWVKQSGYKNIRRINREARKETEGVIPSGTLRISYLIAPSAWQRIYARLIKKQKGKLLASPSVTQSVDHN